MMNRLKIILRNAGKWIGYPLFFLACFLLFAYWTFPYDRVKEYLIQQVEAPAGPGGRREPSGYELEIVNLSPSWVTGVELTGVRLVKLPESPEERPVDVTFESIDARIGLFALLTGTTSLGYEIRLAGGSIEGEYEQSEELLEVQTEIEGVRLRRIGLLRAYAGVPIEGTLGGTLDMRVASEAAETEGSIDLSIARLTIGDGNAKLALPGMSDGVTVETLNAGTLELRGQVEDGVLQIERLRGRGDDLELDGEGSVRLTPQRIAMSRLDLLIRAKILDSYRERNDRTRALFSLMEVNPRMSAAKTTDDALQYRVTGNLGGRLSTQPARNAPAPGGGG